MWPFKMTKGPFKGYTVDLAAQTRVTRYAAAVEKILSVIGHPEALVTDESTVGDFEPSVETVAELCWLLNGPVSTHSYIADLAETLTGPS